MPLSKTATKTHSRPGDTKQAIVQRRCREPKQPGFNVEAALRQNVCDHVLRDAGQSESQGGGIWRDGQSTLCACWTPHRRTHPVCHLSPGERTGHYWSFTKEARSLDAFPATFPFPCSRPNVLAGLLTGAVPLQSVLCPGNDAILDLLGQLREVGIPAGYLHRQVPVVLRLLLGSFQRV